MANKQVIRCGLQPKRASKSSKDLWLNLWGSGKNIELEVPNITEKMAAGLTPRHQDLLEIAAYVYGADQAVGRGGETGRDLGKAWRRHFEFTVAVREPDFWSAVDVCDLLSGTLGFVSEDEYRFEFERLKDPPPQGGFLSLDTSPAEWFNVDEVISFSGGLDSFAGAVQEVLRSKQSVALVSHRASTKIANKQLRLVEELRKYCVQRGITPRIHHFPVWVQKTAALDKEHTQRTRSFLFASLAAVISRMLGCSSFQFFENGVVSLNLPVCEQVVGTRATRTTHPQTLERFRVLFSKVFEQPFAIGNPFIWKTKADVIDVIAENGCADAIRHTVSCSHTIDMTTEQPHCGVCSQCIDRRFGVLAAGAAEHDPESMYRVPLFTASRTKPDEVTMLESYVRRASEVEKMSEQEFIGRYPQAARAWKYLAGSVDDNAHKIYDLYLRHSREIAKVLALGVSRYNAEIVAQSLPRDCLVSMIFKQIDKKTSASKSPGRGRSQEAKPRSRRGQAKAKPNRVVRILHLSDLHFSQEKAWEQDRVLQGLAIDVKRLRKEGVAPDLIVVTGDIANRGKQDEYAVAENWIRETLLPAAGIESTALVLVPGNHDVDRSKVKETARAVQAAILRDRSQDKIARILSDPEERPALLNRHAEWLSFVNRLRQPKEPLAVPWYSESFKIRSLNVLVAAFCSSWMACSDEDRGSLALGRQQVYSLLGDAEAADLVIAAMHHPWDYFAEFDGHVMREEIERRCQLVLRGHLHQHDARLSLNPRSAVLEIAAGASFEGSDSRNAYQIVEIAPRDGVVRVHLRTWDGHEWIPDRNAYAGKSPNGIANFDMKLAR